MENSYRIDLKDKGGQDALKRLVKKYFSNAKDLKVSRTRVDEYCITTEEKWSMSISRYDWGLGLDYIESPDGKTFWFSNSIFDTIVDGIFTLKNPFFWVGTVAFFIAKASMLMDKLDRKLNKEEMEKENKMLKDKNKLGVEKLESYLK